VFATAREKARQTSCASNLKQLGLGIAQYQQDYDEFFPFGLAFSNGSSQGNGWGGQIYPYVKSVQLFACPNETFSLKNKADSYVSYAFNVGMPQVQGPKLTAPTKTVMICEVAHVEANVAVGTGFDTSPFTGQTSPSTEGLCLYGAGPSINAGNPTGVDFATGTLGGRAPTNCGANYNWFSTTTGRHSTGSNFVAADGHVKWLTGNLVSSGQKPVLATCGQYAAGTGCGSNTLAAAGTEFSAFTMTFSTL
jgi:prepilin-type processing-associated H-X9-DG protein